MLEGINIRAASAHDVAQVRAIARAAYAKYVPRIGRQPAPMAADYETDVARQRATVVEIAGQVRAYMIAWPEGDAYFIENIGVDPQFQGHGLGRRLIDHAVVQARHHGLSALSLYTNEAMTENLSLYRRLGFLETRRAREAGYSRVYMRKVL